MGKKPKKLQQLPLTILDYQRMFRVITSVLDSFEAHTLHACIFYSLAGAYLIETVHKRKANPMAGAAFYRLTEAGGFTLAFAKEDEGGFVNSEDGFHCWIECQGFAIDLMAPLFPKSATLAGCTEAVPRQMFQKSFQKMSNSPFDLTGKGDFYLHRNPEMMSAIMKKFLTKDQNRDLVNICEYWYRPYPDPMKPSIDIASSDGTQRTAHLTKGEVEGVW